MQEKGIVRRHGFKNNKLKLTIAKQENADHQFYIYLK
jgi:hypothetical protein